MQRAGFASLSNHFPPFFFKTPQLARFAPFLAPPHWRRERPLDVAARRVTAPATWWHRVCLRRCCHSSSATSCWCKLCDGTVARCRRGSGLLRGRSLVSPYFDVSEQEVSLQHLFFWYIGVCLLDSGVWNAGIVPVFIYLVPY